MNQFPGGNAAPFFAPPQAPARAPVPMPQMAPQSFPVPQRAMPQVQPQGFPNVQRLAQFAQGSPAAPFQGAVQRPALPTAPPGSEPGFAAPKMSVPHQAFAMLPAPPQKFPLARDVPRPAQITGPQTPGFIDYLNGASQAPPRFPLAQDQPRPAPITGPQTPAFIDMLQQPTAQAPVTVAPAVGHRIVPPSTAPSPFTVAPPATAPAATYRRPNVSGDVQPVSSFPLLTSDRRAKRIVSLKSILGA